MKIRPLEERQAAPADVSVVAYPMGIVEVEPTFCLIQGTPTLMMLAIANPKAVEIGSAWVSVDLPTGVELKAVNAFLDWDSRSREAVQRDGKDYTRWKLRVNPATNTIVKGKAGSGWYASHRPTALWLATDAAPGAKLGMAYLGLAYKENDNAPMKEGPPSVVALAVLPKLQAERPSIARSGLMGRCCVSYNDSNTEAPGIIARYIGQMGCNFYLDGPPQSAAPTGVKRWTEGFNIWMDSQGAQRHKPPAIGVGDGFLLHSPAGVIGTMPEEIQFLNADMERSRRYLSPWAAYGRHPWVVQNVLNPITQAIEKGEFESLWANWEPTEPVREAGFGDREKKAFLEWSKLPPDEIDKLWPNEVRKKYPDKWRAFRSWEIGKWTQVLAETVRTASTKAGGDGYFIVATTAAYIFEKNLLLDIAAWGDFPYVFQSWSYHFTPQVNGQYPVTDHTGAPQVQRAGSMARRLDELFGPQRKMRGSCLYGWDQAGYHTGFMEPEQVAFRQLSTILGGLDIVHSYGEWPIFDGRYAAEMATANTRIARWEAYTLQGRKQRKHVVIPVSPYPQTVPAYVRPEDQEPKTWDNYLYSYEYEKDGKRLFLIANCWDLGECFVKLRVLGTDPVQKYLLSEPEANRVFASDKGETALSAADLEEGVVVHVGAVRWGAFLLEPYKRGTAKKMDRISPEQMTAMVQARTQPLLVSLAAGEATFGPERRLNQMTPITAQIASACSDCLAVAREADAPAVDGALDDACWKSADVHGNFGTWGAFDKSKYETSWRAVRHANVLYLGVECAQDMTRPFVQAAGRDGKVWNDDSVEIFLSKFPSGAPEDFLQVIVNPAGTLYDALDKDSGWNGIVASAVRATPQGWSFEVGIPLDQVGILPERDRIVRCNLVRNVIGSQHNTAESSSWFPVWAANDDLKARGLIVLGDR